MDLSHTIIESARLRLVPISPTYRKDMFHEFTDEITTFMRSPTPKSIADTDKFIEKSQKELSAGSELTLVVLLKETGEFVGCCGLHKTNTANPEFGIWVKKSMHGNGYGKEIITAIKKWADTSLPFEHLLYNAAKENRPSRKIAVSLGGTIVHEYSKETGNGVDIEWITYRLPR